MDHNDYKLLHKNEVPNCCGSCEYIIDDDGPTCGLFVTMIDVFGICNKFKKDNTNHE